MTLAFARQGTPGHAIPGSQKRTVTRVTMDTSYQSGGEPVTAADLGLNRVEYATCTIYSTSGGGTNVVGASYDPATSLLHCWNETPAEVTSTNSLSTTVVQVIAYGS